MTVWPLMSERFITRFGKSDLLLSVQDHSSPFQRLTLKNYSIDKKKCLYCLVITAFNRLVQIVLFSSREYHETILYCFYKISVLSFYFFLQRIKNVVRKILKKKNLPQHFVFQQYIFRVNFKLHFRSANRDFSFSALKKAGYHLNSKDNKRTAFTEVLLSRSYFRSN